MTMWSSGSGNTRAKASLLELRPMGVMELVDGALEVCARHIGALLLIVLPGYLLLGAGLLVLVSFAELPPPQYAGGFQFYFLAGVLISVLLFASHISHGAGVYYLYRAEVGLPVSAGGALRRALKHGGSLILVAGVTYMIAGVAAFLFFVPGIAVYSLFALCTPVVMVEDIRYMRALKRGYRMLRDFFIRALLAHVLLGVVWLVVLLTLHAMVHMGLAVARSFFDLEVGLLSNAFSLFNLTYLASLNVLIMLAASSVISALAVLLYIDVRVRTEGIDIERRIESLPAPGGRSSPAQLSTHKKGEQEKVEQRPKAAGEQA